MENLDILLLTAIVVVLYTIFLGNTYREFSKMADKATKVNKDRETNDLAQNKK
jgi:hypothetical protein